ncbi:fimbrial protein [Enterobacter sp. 22325]|uniref:fimbrial protein n=1 Tax=Enterobacter sp. 22325 TaxID=3453911 RepID=UPI003F85A772
MNTGSTHSCFSSPGLIAIAATLLLSAASLHAGNWDVDGLNGSLLASGMLVSSPCVLMMESRMQEISMDSVSSMSLKQLGDVTLPVDVHIILDDCPGGAHRSDVQKNVHGGLWLSDQSPVRMKVTGEPAMDDRHFFSIHGAAGISLRLEGPDGKLLIPGLDSQPFPLVQGRNDLQLKAQLWRNSVPLQPGPWLAVVNLNMEYE